MAEDVTLLQAVDLHIRSYLHHHVHTAIPARVEAYDEVTNTCFATPTIGLPVRNEDGDLTYEQAPVIPFVPVCFPRAGDYIITFPLAEGDTVLLVFSELSTAEWLDSGDFSEPIDVQKFSDGYPFAIPGAFPGGAKPLSNDPTDRAARTGGIVIGKHNGENRIEISSTGIKLGKTAVDFVALASKVDAVISTIANAVPVANDGGAAILAALNAYLALNPTVAASEVKAK